MKRPYLIHFYAIESGNKLKINGSMGLYELGPFPYVLNKNQHYKPQNPMNSFSRFTSTKYLIKIEGFNKIGEKLFSVIESTDDEGRLKFNMAQKTYHSELNSLNIYEVSFYSKVDLFLGHYIPLKINLDNFNLVISDFDKTLVDTKYSNAREVYKSLTDPLENFPIVNEGMDKLKELIKKGYTPFVLSASPHFYEEAIRDCLYKNKIFNAEIFLKDYRKIFSIMGFELGVKDITAQGVYKFNSLLTILNLTGIPKTLTLMGDSYESDPLIYSLFKFSLGPDFQEELLIYLFEHNKAFNASQDQISMILKKLRHLKSKDNSLYTSKSSGPQIDIFIRNIQKKEKKEADEKIPQFLEKYFKSIIPL